MAVNVAAHGVVVVERLGGCLTIRAASAPAGGRPEAMPPAEPGRIAVAVDGSAAPALHALDRSLLTDLRRHVSASPGRPTRATRCRRRRSSSWCSSVGRLSRGRR